MQSEAKPNTPNTHTGRETGLHNRILYTCKALLRTRQGQSILDKSSFPACSWMYTVPPVLQMTLTQLSVPALLTALLAAVSAAAQAAGKKTKPTVNIVKSNTRSMNLNYYEALTTTRVTDCYNENGTVTPCIEPCGGTSYDVNAFVMVGDVPMIDLSAFFSDNCAGADGTYYSACAMVKVPPATWVQFQKKASLKLTAKLGLCQGEAGTNPLVGTMIDVDVKLACDKQTIDNSRCSGSTVAPVVSNNNKYKYVYMSKTCNFEATPGLKVNGKPKTFDNVSFGTSKTKDVNYVF
jgi:hypothetical protein